MICFKKKTRNFTYLCAAFCFALLGSLFFCRSSAYADSGISNTTSWMTYTTDPYHAPNWTTRNFSGTITSTYYNTGDHRSTGFGLRAYGVHGNISAQQVLTGRITIHIQFNSWNGSQSIFTPYNCVGMYYTLFPMQNNTILDVVNDVNTITSCSIVGSSSQYGNLSLDLDYTFSFNEVTLVNAIDLDIFNPPTFSSPNDGYILACDPDNNHWNFPLCASTSEQYTWPNWYVASFDVSFESTTDPQTAIMWEQLALQRQEWAQNQTDRQDYTDLDGEGQEQGNDAGDQATNVGNSLLTIFGNFISAVYNIHTTNCMLPDLSYNGVVLRNMNLCTLSIPTPLAAIGSIGLVFILVPLAIHVVNRMINMYKEIFGQ